MDRERTRPVRTVISLIIVVIILAFLAWLIFFRETRDARNDTSAVGQAETSQDATAADKATDESKAKQDATATQKSATQTNPPASSQQLTAAGPGNVLAIFIGTAILAAVAHYTYRRRTLSRAIH